VAQLTQQSNVGFANRATQITGSGQAFGLFQQIGRALIGLESFAQNNAGLTFLFLLAAAAQISRKKSPNEERNQRHGQSDYDNLRHSRQGASGPWLYRLRTRKQIGQPAK